MRLRVKIALLSSVVFVLAGIVLFAGGCVSTPRNFASPSASIRVVDMGGASIGELEVSRNWYDGDTGKDGSDVGVAIRRGVYEFSKIPANVGLFTGAWRKACSNFGMCPDSSGTHTEIYIRFHGRYEVAPQDKPLHQVGKSRQDPDGIDFEADLDSQSNTLVHLTFPPKAKRIDYILSARPH